MLTLGAQELGLQERYMNNKQIKKNCNQYVSWSTIPWPDVRRRVHGVQCSIYKASLEKNKGLVQQLQKKLIDSMDAKCLAVYTVTTLNTGKYTAGIDRISIARPPYLSKKNLKPKYRALRLKLKLQKKALNLLKKSKPVFVSAEVKMKMVRSLVLNGKASPVRRVWVPKPGKIEKRPLGIPTLVDRAKQALAKLALEPEWEAVFEPNSYGFRPSRRCHDAIEAIFLSLHHKVSKWVYDADIKKCFERIDHDALLSKMQTFPQLEEQVRAWLKADIMEGYANAPKEITPSLKGTPQGGVISPLLANIALHGLEHHLKEYVASLPIRPTPNSNRGKMEKMKALSIIRYADDFILTHVNKQIMDLCIERTSIWLGHMGLEISQEKSKLKRGTQLFNFLGFSIIQVRKVGIYKVKITPSREKIKTFLLKISNIIQANKSASAYQLISQLRPVIIGWANYYKFCECSDTFSTLTHRIFQKLRAWVFRRDTRNGRKVIKEKYFPSGKEYTFNGTLHRDNWILFGTYKSKKKTKHTFLPHISWVHSLKFVKIVGSKSPFDNDHLYWTLRGKRAGFYSTRVSKLLLIQKGKCKICKGVFNNLDRLEVDHIIPKSQGGKDTYTNLQLLHRSCHITKTASD